MKNIIVVDASLALKWVLVEADSDKANALLLEWTGGGIALTAPALFVYEVTNILYRKIGRGLLTLDEAKQSLATLLRSGITLHFPNDSTLSLRSMELAHRFHLPAAYDPQYLALAEREGCEYWTADERLWNSVKRELAWVRWLGEYHPTP